MTKLLKIYKGVHDPTCIPHSDFMEASADLIRTTGNKYKLAIYF